MARRKKDEIEVKKNIVPELKKKHAGGRPTKYSKDLADKICDTVASTTDGLRKMCSKNTDFPTSETILQWRFRYPEFSSQYKQAKLHQADLLAEEIIDIADDDSGDTMFTEYGVKMDSEYVARSRLRVEARKWHVSKLLPKVYGDRMQTDSTVTMIPFEDTLKGLDK